MSKDIESRKAGRASEVGFLVASAVVPRSFQKSLLPRDTTDQGIITGISMIMAFTLASTIQSAIDITTDKISKRSEKDSSLEQDDYSILASLAAFGIGMSSQKIFEETENEMLAKSAARTLGYWVSVVGVAGIVAGVLEKMIVGASESDNKQKAAKRRKYLLPAVVPVGALLTYTMDHIKHRKEQAELKISPEEKNETNLYKAMGIGVGIAGVLGLISVAERFMARKIDNFLGSRSQLLKNSWLPVGQIVSLGLVGLGIYEGMRRLYRKSENGNEKFEEYYTEQPSSRLVSGSKQSQVDWETLSLQGRRHITDTLTKEKINEVLDIKNAVDPIRVYIGLESALTESERVGLALEELQRTGAFDRELLVIVSPTGTGYVNYVFSESVELMSKGNCASVTIQYSLRPSPMSLDQVPEGRDHFRMLVNLIHQEIKKRPKNKRPKIVLFGESLGAWTSQDAFVNSGTYMLEALDIEAGFWIGTPAGSKWAKQVTSAERYDTDRKKVGVFNDFGQYKSLPPQNQKALKYVMVTHDNDPIPKFGGTLLVKQPEWLNENGQRSNAISKTMHWNTPRTFIQLMVDMKNALKPIPGEFVSIGHDYRADIADFVEAVYNFNVTKKQRVAIDLALRKADIERGKTQA